MKNLNNILEGILGDIDDNIESGVRENQILKLLDKWATINSGYKAKKGTDALGNNLEVGDWVMCWGGIYVEFGKIINVDWNVANGSNLTVIKNSKPREYYVNKFTGGLALNARADHCIKLDEKSTLTILKALCAH